MSVEYAFDYNTSVAGILNFEQKDIDELRKWVNEEVGSDKFIPKNISDKQLLLFHNACNLNMEDTKKCIEIFYITRKNAPELFNNRTLEKDPTLKSSMETLEFSVLPKKSPEGYDVIFHRLHDPDPSKYNMVSGLKMLIMTVDACLYNRGASPGVIFLFDMKGIRLTHLTKLNIGALKKLFHYIQEAAPIKMKAIHVMNPVFFFDKLLAILRPFMFKELIDLIKLHPASENMEEFYATVLPRECLPPDYGGTLPDTQTLHKQNLKILTDMEQYFIDEEAQRMAAINDTSIQQHSDVENSWKTLEVD